MLRKRVDTYGEQAVASAGDDEGLRRNERVDTYGEHHETSAGDDERKIKDTRSHKAGEKVDWNTCIGRLFAKGYLDDDKIQDFVERNLCKLLLLLVFIILVLFGSVRSFLKRSLKRSIPPPSTTFCRHNTGLCGYNRYVKALMYDFRQSRDIVANPEGTHNVVTPGLYKLDVCEMPVQLYYEDKRIEQYWGHILGKQEEGLSACQTPCVVSTNKSDADVLIGMLRPPYEGKEWWQRTAAVNLEAHSLDASSLAATDILVSFHKQSDVQVNYLYGLSHGMPCTVAPTSVLKSSTVSAATVAIEEALAANKEEVALAAKKKEEEAVAQGARSPPARMGQRKNKAVLFMSRLCDRHGGFAEKLIAAINWDIGVDSYGKCFRNSDERAHARYVRGSAEASKERIASTYKFNIVIENTLVDDYVTEKFFEGLKSASLMVYLGAPNIREYAPARHSFVDAADFADARHLARFLVEIENNQTLYDSFFHWRRPPHVTNPAAESTSEPSSFESAPAGVSADFEALQANNFVRSDHRSWQCRVCNVYVSRYCAKMPGKP